MSRPIRVLELRSVWGTGGGPDKTILTGARLHDPARVALTVCYIRDARDRVFALDRRAAELGIDYTEVVERHSFDPGIWPKLRDLTRARKIDLVHSHDYKTDGLAWALAKRTGVIPLSTAHGFAGVSWSQRSYYAVEKRLLARFPRVIAVANHIKAELVRTGSRPERVTVINNGIDPHAFHRDPARRAPMRRELGYADEDIVIGAVGRLESEKCFDLLLGVIAELRRTHPRVRLAIVGEGSLRAPLEAQMARLDLTSAVQLLGHRTDVIALHHAFDIFVQSSEREGTPNAVLEAMAMETPIVATDVGGTSELATDGVHALLVPKHDPAQL
ncbi:MAG TPA: glycosyltransferase, partial [Vicinamibacterales bacterium]|nr:glycosyltransferase [Vicinamibacterales bacterium]